MSDIEFDHKPGVDKSGTYRVRVEHPGVAFVDPPPANDGWECVWVARIACSHTTFTYRRTPEAHAEFVRANAERAAQPCRG